MADLDPLEMLANYNYGGSIDAFLLKIQQGKVPGHKIINKFARGSFTTAEVTLWENTSNYTFIATPTILDITSTDNTQDKSSGTGALSVHVKGTDSNGDLAEEIILTNGTTISQGSVVFASIYSMHLETVGSGGTNVGIIKAKIGATVHGQINVNAGNRTRMGVLTIPNNYSGFIFNYWSSIGKTLDALVSMHEKTTGKAKIAFYDTDLYENSIVQQKPWLPIPQNTELEIRAIAGANTSASAGFDILLVKNN